VVADALPPELKQAITNFAMRTLEIEEAEAVFDEKKRVYTELKVSLARLLKEAGVKSVKLESYGSFSPSFMGPYASIKKPQVIQHDGEDPTLDEFDEGGRAALEAWAKEQFDEANNCLFDELFKLMPISSRLSKVVKTAIEEGTEIPPGVEWRTVDTVRWTRDPKYKKKGE
jgi:hypothetical protein